LLLVSNTCHSKKGFWGTTNTFDGGWVGGLVGRSVGHLEKNPTWLHFPKFFDPLFFCSLFGSSLA
jgi:hypothetical protein